MVCAGVPSMVVNTFVRHKPLIRVTFNTAQYMLATGLAGLAYSTLGGSVSLDSFDFTLIPFAGLVVTFFVVNKGSVSLAVSLSNGLSVREAWGRIGKDAIGTDLFSSTLAALLVFRSEEHTSELQSQSNLVCRLLLEKKNNAYSRLTSPSGPPSTTTSGTYIPIVTCTTRSILRA